MATERRLADFEGVWRIKRQIIHADGTQGRFLGEAVFVRTDGGLDYTETGQLNLGTGASLTATQSYRWEEGLKVYFGDGRFFHHVPPLGGDTEHWCDPDDYRGTYDFTAWPEFTVTWQVKGPRKDYRSETRYTVALARNQAEGAAHRRAAPRHGDSLM